MQYFPQTPQSLWIETETIPHFPTLKEDISVDVAVIGGGIAGITTAYVLMQEGLKVVLIDADELLKGTTGHTTAKITAQHGLVYHELIKHFGKEKAEMYFKANQEGAELIQTTIEKLNIACSYDQHTAYIYTNAQEYVKKIEQEYAAYNKLHIKGELKDDIPINIPVKAAITMEHQAQFHPLTYMHALVKQLDQQGVMIFEHTEAIDIKEEKNIKVITKNDKTISCTYVCSCTHFPFYDRAGLYFSRLYAERSYLLAIKPIKAFPGGMYVNVENPTRTFREIIHHNEKLLLVGGENHKAGQGSLEMQHYEALRHFAKNTFGIEQYLYRWSTQDLSTLDNVPYIGPMTKKHPNILIATGFKKWGMTTSHLAAMLLRDYILGKRNSYNELFSPIRFEAAPMVKTFLSTNLDVAKHFVKDKFDLQNQNICELQKDEAAIFRIKGKRAGAYKDKNGKLYIVDTTCTHLGCELQWNSGDRTWDCPCHGSRFNITGEVIEGPAKQPLTILNIEE
ncbi:FAD-dependent oxidoreductase [Heyndrickxia ginsengihumi]|uniref:FAD-dependent oxidoreductase n=1 Tax=Heyndrickxia ginsengihumi TaxID=363870 RepID=UPI0004B421A4|nr:FAD-dependent oxidoreductase [Heyndrickxia ginsengihumi]